MASTITEYTQSQNDLHLAFRRIAHLQAVLEEDVDSEDNESSEDDGDR